MVASRIEDRKDARPGRRAQATARGRSRRIERRAGEARAERAGRGLDLGHVLFSPEGRFESMDDAAFRRVGRARRVAMTRPVLSGARRVAAQEGLETFRAPMPAPRLEMIRPRRSMATPAHARPRAPIAEAAGAEEAAAAATALVQRGGRSIPTIS